MIHAIWNANPDFEDWTDDLAEQYPDASEDELWELMHDINNDYLDDERSNLNIQLSQPILVIANLGLWFGHRVGYKEIQSGNVKDCFYSDYDPEWYVDDLGDLRCNDYHHDGVNHYLYRVWKDISEKQKKNFLAKLLQGNVTRRDITRYTSRLGDAIGGVYGWTFKGGNPLTTHAES